MRRTGPALALAALVLAGACSTGGPSKDASGGRAASPAAPTASALAQACTATSSLPASPAGVRTGQPVWTLASGLDQPDDLLFHDGRLYVGERGGTIDVLTAGQAPTQLPVRVPEVEGMAFWDSTLYVADQRNDRVVSVDGDQVRTFLQLQPVAGQDAVDGIVAVGDQLVVPDSPRGVVDWFDRSGRIVRTAAGFVRPTGAWPLPDGSLLVADEYGGTVVRLASDGSRTYVTRSLPIADDVVADGDGTLFVVAPVASGGRLVQIAGGSNTELASGLSAPQGLALDSAGNVYFSESGAGRIDLLVRSFKIEPIATTPISSGGSLCIDIFRATGFTGDVELTGGPGLRVLEQPGTGTRGAVQLLSCAASPCELVARSGARSDRTWLSG